MGEAESVQLNVCASVLSRFSCVQLFETLWIVSHQATLHGDSPDKNTGAQGPPLGWADSSGALVCGPPT